MAIHERHAHAEISVGHLRARSAASRAASAASRAASAVAARTSAAAQASAAAFAFTVLSGRLALLSFLPTRPTTSSDMLCAGLTETLHTRMYVPFTMVPPHARAHATGIPKGEAMLC